MTLRGKHGRAHGFVDAQYVRPDDLGSARNLILSLHGPVTSLAPSEDQKRSGHKYLHDSPAPTFVT